MDTPICDFVREYAGRDAVRLHMPGHKGKTVLGPERLDITEIPGADVLYAAEGIIRRSEDNAAALFGSARTIYSTEGSSLCIRAMGALALFYARLTGRPGRIAAGRNAHKSFLTAAALLGLDVTWLYPSAGEDRLSCAVTPETLEATLSESGCAAVLLTGPDYLGGCPDVASLAAVCHRHGALLLVDNAHGAYLKFMEPSRHPLDLGADLCCDSAHKTLPVLTGGAYLHFSKTCPPALLPMGEQAMGLFASTSPSYLILQSLDAANRALSEELPAALRRTAARLDALKARLAGAGWMLTGAEPLKLTLCPKARGYTGAELARRLEEKDIFCEFADADNVVFMFSPGNGEGDFAALEAALDAMPPAPPIPAAAPPLPRPRTAMSPREAMLSPRETLPAERCLGRVLADPSVSCPPAVPVLVCGEVVDETALAAMRYYGVEKCAVVTETGERA